MKNILSIAIAVLLCASTTAHAQQVKEETVSMGDRSEAVSIANASFATCQITISTHERNNKYDHLPFCERDFNFHEEFPEEGAESSTAHQEEASVIL